MRYITSDDKNLKQVNKIELIKKLKIWATPYYKPLLLCLFLLIIRSFITIINPIIVQKAVDNYIVPKNFNGLALILCLYISILIVGLILQYTEIVKLETTGQTIIANIKNALFKHILFLDMKFFDKSETGKLVSRIENDTNAMKSLFTYVITHGLGNLILLAGVMVVMLTYNLKLSLILFSLLPLIIILGVILDRFVSPRLINLRKIIAELSGYITEIIQGISIVQIFGQEEKVMKELNEKSLNKLNQEIPVSIMFNTFFNILFFFETLAIIPIIIIGGSLIIEGKMTIGTVILFVTFIRYLLMPIMFLSEQFAELQKGIAAASRVFELFDTNKEIQNIISTSKFGNEFTDIEFRNVWFKYNDDAEWALRDVSFYCSQNEHWAIVGPTGSGKTTIISLLLKFYLPQKGEILINGKNIKDISTYEIRKKIGLVLQDNILFSGNIYDNLVLEQDTHSHDDISNKMKDIDLDSIILKMQDGYNTELQENASNLSSGEMQLISFGRALLKNPSLLVLDEATSNIDPDTEKKIKKAMQTLLKGRTALIVAHRFSTIQNLDKILVLRHGKVIEQGNHKELITKGGFYSELNTLQVN